MSASARDELEAMQVRAKRLEQLIADRTAFDRERAALLKEAREKGAALVASETALFDARDREARLRDEWEAELRARGEPFVPRWWQSPLSMPVTAIACAGSIPLVWMSTTYVHWYRWRLLGPPMVGCVALLHIARIFIARRRRSRLRANRMRPGDARPEERGTQ